MSPVASVFGRVTNFCFSLLRCLMDLSEFDFLLPSGQIAQYPAEKRDGSRLLHFSRCNESLEHFSFSHFPSLLNSGDALVVNKAKVFPARLYTRRSVGEGRVELLLIRRDEGGCWQAIGKPTKRLKAGDSLCLKFNGKEPVTLRVVKIAENGRLFVRFEGSDLTDEEIINVYGEVPLPPYLHRDATVEDVERYQTVYAEGSGAVAAPTAGLHFTDNILELIRAMGVGVIPLTLNVGPGTFAPVRSADPRVHKLEAEWYQLNESSAREIRERKQDGGRIVAVGTTTVRTLESLADDNEIIRSGSGWTDRYIIPPYRFRVVDALLTNFHLPQSTLLMLVAAFAGTRAVLEAYNEAVMKGYRFYSYGDAMFIT